MADNRIVIEKKILLIGTQASYDALDTYDEEVLYFCSDTRNVYRGSVLYTDGVRKVETRPTKPATGILYFIASTKTLEFYDGNTWVEATTKVNTTNTINAQSTTEQIPSAKAVYDFVGGRCLPFGRF